MQRIYQASNSIEAHMIVHLLEQAGVHAHVEGEHLQSGAGELPVGSLVAVAVADNDVAQAREVIREWEARTPPDKSDSSTATRSRAVGQGIAFLAGALLVGGISWLAQHGPQAVDPFDHNGDGKPDERFIYDGEQLERSEADRDFDGRVDATTQYEGGFIASYHSDDDFDGRLESTTIYSGGQPQEWRVDYDGDGRTDFRSTMRHGVPAYAEYLSAAGKVRKRVDYAGSRPAHVYLDLNEDGVWDRTYRFDELEEPVYE